MFVQMHVGPVFALARIQEIIYENSFQMFCQNLRGIRLGANTCRGCICTRASIGENSPLNYLCIGFVTGANIHVLLEEGKC